MPDPQTEPVIVAGAGIGGLCAAIRLAAAGRHVALYEQNPAVGGKMSEVRAAGFRWDTGPSVITMRHVLEALFHSAGRRMDDYLTLLPINPMTRYFFWDGTVLDATSNLAQMATQIEAIEPRDVEGYLRFLAYAARLYRITGPAFLYDQPPTWRSFLRISPLDLFKIDPWLTMDQAIRRHVRSPYLRQLLGRYATYVGASPYQAPATLSVIAHVELTGGVWYPRGGVYAIARALAKLAGELGVEIHTNAPISRICIEHGQATGIELADGSRAPASAVIANVDVATVYHHLLADSQAYAIQRQHLARRQTSCSGYVLLLGVTRTHPQLAHHNVFFAKDYRREFDELFQLGIPPSDPTIYLAITSKTDVDHAPPGCENWFVLVNAPPINGQFDWALQEPAYRRRVFAALARHGLEIEPYVCYARSFTPVDLAQHTGAWRGALYGLSSNNPLTAFRRPHNRAANVRGLYFVGGTTHPGGGVPLAALSGKVTADLLVSDPAF